MKFGPKIDTIWRINGRFLYAIFLYSVAYGYWSITSRYFYFFGVLAVFAALAATAYLLRTFWEIFVIILNSRIVGAYGDLGEAPKGDNMASNDAERRAGMHDE